MEKWSYNSALQLFNQPFFTLMNQAQSIHNKNFDANKVQISTLLSIKTGACPENCSYCPQSAHYQTNSPKEPLMDLEEVLKAAQKAKAAGSTRFCMGAAWRGPNNKQLPKVCEMIREVKKLGLETCATLGLLKENQADELKSAGLDFYNHNIDTSKEYYSQIITTRCFEDRLATLEQVRKAGIKVCCGGILGMGETQADRIKMLVLLANMPNHPESVPINKLIPIPGTPLANKSEVDFFEFAKTIALARIMMPKSYIRLSAGRQSMSKEQQAWCFFAGINSIFYGDKLLTADNPEPNKDDMLLASLGLSKEELVECKI